MDEGFLKCFEREREREINFVYVYLRGRDRRYAFIKSYIPLFDTVVNFYSSFHNPQILWSNDYC